MTTDISRISDAVINEIDELLEDTNKIPMQTVFRLNLSVSKEMTLALNRLIVHVNEQNDRIATSENKIKELQQNNIIGWVKGNPKLSFIYLFLFILLTDITVDKLSSIDSLSVVLAILKKWLGI